MNLRALLAAAVLLPAGASFAAVGDPCTPDVTDANGNVTTENFTERCDGAQVIFCVAPAAGQPTVETAQNCAELFPGAPVGICDDVAGVGPTCAFADGDDCAFSAGADNPFIPFPCQTATSGCINGTCTAGAGACADGSPGVCSGDAAAFCAPWGQLVGNACAGWVAILELDDGGGTLSCEGAGVCAGIGTGGDCGADFTCATDTCTAGVCEAAEGEGEPAEGEGEGGNDRDDEPEPAPAGCFNAFGVLPMFGPFALVLLALRRRRR